VLTSADGQNAYGKSINFIEDLALIEEAHNEHEDRYKTLPPLSPLFDSSRLTLEKAVSLKPVMEIEESKTHRTQNISSGTDLLSMTGPNQRETLKNNQYQDSNESEEDGDIVLMPNGQRKQIPQTQIKEVEQALNVEAYKPLEKGKYFIEKSIFVISRHPFFD